MQSLGGEAHPALIEGRILKVSGDWALMMLEAFHFMEQVMLRAQEPLWVITQSLNLMASFCWREFEWS